MVGEEEAEIRGILEEIKKRKKIIRDFYATWNAANPTKQIYNANLKEFITSFFDKSMSGNYQGVSSGSLVPKCKQAIF